MNPNMSLPIFLVFKAFWAHFTLEILLHDAFAVALQMRNQVSFFSKRFCTKCAPVFVFNTLQTVHR